MNLKCLKVEWECEFIFPSGGGGLDSGILDEGDPPEGQGLELVEVGHDAVQGRAGSRHLPALQVSLRLVQLLLNLGSEYHLVLRRRHWLSHDGGRQGRLVINWWWGLS